MPAVPSRRGETEKKAPVQIMIKAIFFDFNGVIINDERIHLKAYREILSAEGVELTDQDYFASLGMDDVAFVRAAYARGKKDLNDETMRDVIEREHAKHRELIAINLPVPSGVISFIKAAARHFDLGIVSMAVRSEIDHVLKLAGITKEFSLIVSAEPGLRHKPAPDCYKRALELLNEKRRSRRDLPLLAKECVVIEDAPPGIESGRGAGMRTIGVTTTVTEQALRTAGADIVTPNLADWSPDAIHHLFD
jgi:HAD superfamily hydrolase (TIGR01509 family)